MSIVNPTKKPFFFDENKEIEFNKNGFAEINSFLEESLCDELLNYFNEFYKNKQKNGMWFSSKNEGIENAFKLSEILRNKIEPLLISYFKEFKVEIYTMINKPFSVDGFMGLHRDYSISNEETFQYRNVWIPLIDVNKNNGTIFLIPESHRFNQNHRWGNIEKTTVDYSQLFDEKKIFECKKGTAIIYADRTLHGSFENKTNENRPVIHFGLVYQDVEYLMAKEDRYGNIHMEKPSLSELINQK